MTERSQPAVIDEDLAPVTSSQERPVEESSTPRSRGVRRFLRFNLFTLLVALLLVTVYFGVRQRFAVSPAENRAKRELTALHSGYTLGPAPPVWLQYVLVQFGEDSQHVDTVTFPPYFPHVNDVREAERLTAEDLASLARLPLLRKVDFTNAMFDEAGLAALRQCDKLEEIVLSETLVGDQGIERLAGHPSLSIVRIDRTLTSDAALKTLAQIPNLTEISIDDATTAEGIAVLAKAPKLKTVDAEYTALRDSDLGPLAHREVAFSMGRPRWLPGDAPPDELSFWYQARYDGAHWTRAEGRHLTDPRYLAQLAELPNVCVVNVHDDEAVDPERLSSLLAMPQILEIYLDAPGPPIPYAAVEEVAARVRPADAVPCIVNGNVAITGQELIRECEKVRNVRRKPTSPIYAPYVIKALREQDVDRLNELASGTDVRIQPHTDSPDRLVSQSSLLSDLSPVFVQIPMP